VLETAEELTELQALLDASMASAGPHLRDIADEHGLSAIELTEGLQGMRLLVLATVTADGRPLAGPVDGYFLHGTFWFSTGRNAVRLRHLARRPACSATHLPGEELAVTVHGRAEFWALDDPANEELRQAMLDQYLPRVGPEFEQGLEAMDAVGIRIVPEKMFTFHMEGEKAANSGR
jgi:general stress protein 26